MKLLTVALSSLLILAGCATSPAAENVYALNFSGQPASESLRVVDNRPEEEKLLRMGKDATLYLGDQNFSPSRMKVLAERLAARSGTRGIKVLQIDSFELMVHDSTGRTGAFSTGMSTTAIVGKPGVPVTIPSSVMVEFMRPWSDRTVICAITGQADGRVFEVNEYKKVSPKEIGKGLDDILGVAVEKAAEQLVGKSQAN